MMCGNLLRINDPTKFKLAPRSNCVDGVVDSSGFYQTTLNHILVFCGEGRGAPPSSLLTRLQDRRKEKSKDTEAEIKIKGKDTSREQVLLKLYLTPAPVSPLTKYTLTPEELQGLSFNTSYVVFFVSIATLSVK